MTVTVRPAVLGDIPAILPMIREFCLSYPSQTPLWPGMKQAERQVDHMIHAHLCLVAERTVTVSYGGGDPEEQQEIVGFVAGYITPHPINPDILTLTEAAWWIEPEARRMGAGSALLDAYVAAGRAIVSSGFGATWVTMALEADSSVPESVLTKRGFRLMERAYLLEVAHEPMCAQIEENSRTLVDADIARLFVKRDGI